MVFYDLIWKEFSDTGRSTGSYIVYYQVVPIYSFARVPGPFAKYSADSEYNIACNALMALSHFMMINNELLNKNPDVVPEQAHLVILYRQSYICISKNGKDTKHIRHISRRIHFVRNVEECTLHKRFWYEVGL